eukprot:6604607-Prymnesium_polylepis.2
MSLLALEEDGLACARGGAQPPTALHEASHAVLQRSDARGRGITLQVPHQPSTLVGRVANRPVVRLGDVVGVADARGIEV